MNLRNPKLHLLLLVITLLINVNGMAQVAGTNNTLQATGITSIQSGTAVGYKLSVGGAVKIFGTGSNGLGSASLYLGNTTASTGRKFFLNSDNIGSFRFMDSLYATPRFIIDSSGKIGIGIAAPTSIFHLKAGSNTLAPFKFTSGANLTTPAAGAMEYDGTNLFFTPSATRKTIAFTDFSNVSGSLGVTNGGTGLTTLSTGDVLYGSATNLLSKLTAGSNGQVLTLIGGIPSWETPGVVTGWLMNGNSGTTPGQDFLGTIDAQRLVFKTNNNEQATILANGNTGIGITNPAYKLDVTGNFRTTLDANINGISVGKGTNGIATSTALGFNALNISTGTQNTAIGYSTGSNITTGIQNTAVGYASMNSTAGSGGVGLGSFAMQNWVSGNYNIGIGYDALHGSGTGTANIGIGRNVLGMSVTGNYNVGLGYLSLNTLTSGSNNIGIGYFAGNNLTTGSNNIFIGTSVAPSSIGVNDELNIGNWIYGAVGNIGIGVPSPSEKLDVTGNVKFSGALMPNNTAGTTGQVLTSAGAGVAPTWTTPASVTSSAWGLTGNGSTDPATNFIGTIDNQPVSFRVNNVNAGKLTSTGFVSLGYEANRVNNNATNTAIGHQAFYNITGSGTDWSTAIGYQAGYSNISGWNSTFIGYQAGYNNTTGRNSTATGTYALQALTTGYNNAALGAFALSGLTIGQNNTAIGFQAGRSASGTIDDYYSVVDNNCVFLGMYASRDNSIPRTSVLTNAVAIGYNAKVAASNSLILGGIGSDAVNVGIGTTTPGSLLHVEKTTNGGTALSVINPNAGMSAAAVITAGSSLEAEQTMSMYYGGSGNSVLGALTANLLANGGTTGGMNINVIPNAPLNFLTTNATRMTITGSGKVLIGTTNETQAGDHKLAVNGSALFTKAVVKLNANWPDYVFNDSYQLPSLKDLEAYVIKNKHLPGMPSAVDVEMNGIDLGDNQTILLKKVEELTLYMIELNKKVEALAKENEQLKKKQNENNQ